MVDNREMDIAASSPGLLNRTLRSFRRAWRGAGIGTAALREAVESDLEDVNSDQLREHFRACLEARGGEVEARSRAADLGATYLALSPSGQRRFADILAEYFDSDRDAINVAIENYQGAQQEGEEAEQAALARLRSALVAPRVRLLTRFNELSLGVKFLVDLRADILTMTERSAALRGLEKDLKALLLSWFDIGFLELTRITWNTPAAVLEKLIEYEAVHAIRSWDDLKHRLDDDRRCYAFFHPCMPDEPLIFVQVALVTGLSANVYDLLDEEAPVEAPENADTAIFYSISNCQTGLAGVSFGNFLIKQVASDLSKDLPQLKTFSTLSPIPGFRTWLLHRLREDADRLLSETYDAALSRAASNGAEISAHEALLPLVESPELLTEPEAAENFGPTLERVLKHLCARYLLEERRGERALDPVAHFHLSNGARIERLNWLGDPSSQGLSASLGMMVNYRYVLPNVDKNHEAYSSKGTISATTAVRKLLKT